MDKEAQSKVVEAQNKVIDVLNKHYGENTIMRFTSDFVTKVDVIPTGSFFVNKALGVGGYPRGRIIEIYGPESSGKTTLTLHAIAECQKNGGSCLFIDAEHALDIGYARSLGVDIDSLMISQPGYGEMALGIAENFAKSKTVDLIVVDSVAALVPKSEIEGDMGDSHVGLQARLMSQAMRKLTAVAAQTNCTIIFINQLRSKIGVMFGSPETTTGGNALKFYASVRLDIRRIGTIKKGDDAIGNRTRVKVVKNKVAPPFQEAEFDILFGKGVNYPGEIIDAAVEKGVVKKAGAWYSYADSKLGQGRDNAVETLSQDEALLSEIVEQLK